MLKRFKVCVLVTFLYLLAGCVQEKTARRVPLEDFFRNPEKTNFQISPDGRYISFLKPFENRLNLYVQPIGRQDAKRITHLQGRNVGFYCWANNNQLIFSTDNRTGAFLYSVNKDGEGYRELLSDEKLGLKLINTKNIVNGELLVGLNKRDSTVFDAYRLNISNGNLKLAGENPGNIFQWFSDEEGKLRMALASDGVNETLLFRTEEDNHFKPIITNNFKSRITPVGFCDSLKTCIYAISNINRDKSALVKFDCKTGREVAEVFSHKDVDVSDGGYSYKKKKLIYVSFETWKKERLYLDSSAKIIYTALQKLLPNTEVVITDQDTSDSNFIVRTFTDRSQGAFYLYNARSKKLILLSEINPSLKEKEMCSMKPIVFKNREGLTINGYLTLPLGFKPKKLPVVVLPHGGPASRNSWGYSSEVQFLANRGYAVFQVNFRGSDGYGKRFWIAAFKKWGTIVQNDITDGVKWLISQGVADEKRIGIYGSGFGGFCALNGLCYQPDLYACGASQAGYTNLFSYLKAVPPYYKPTLQMYYEMIGDPETDIDYLRQASPVFHADRIKRPVLIAQDAKDARVKVNETNQFVRELRKRKIPVTYIVKEKEKYSLRNPENRIDFYTRLESFLNENLSEK